MRKVNNYVVAFNRLFARANGMNRRGWCVQKEGDPGLWLFATEEEAVAWAKAH